MADKQTYEVMRPMQGDRFYRQGETRVMTEGDARHLVASGALRKMDADVSNKMEPGFENKAEQPARGGRKGTAQ